MGGHRLPPPPARLAVRPWPSRSQNDASPDVQLRDRARRYIEVPRDPQLAYEFLKVEPRTIQPKGVKWRNLVYKGDVLTELGKMKSPYEGKFKDRWPIHIDPDDISRVYIRHRETREWHELAWEHASNVPVDHTSGQGNVHVIAPEVAGVDFDGVAEPNSSDGEVLEPNRDQLCR
jgi:hypothetical protein